MPWGLVRRLHAVSPGNALVCCASTRPDILGSGRDLTHWPDLASQEVERKRLLRPSLGYGHFNPTRSGLKKIKSHRDSKRQLAQNLSNKTGEHAKRMGASCLHAPVVQASSPTSERSMPMSQLLPMLKAVAFLSLHTAAAGVDAWWSMAT
eukprot:1148242-Pelagomonas_calceolata.AAC.4